MVEKSSRRELLAEVASLYYIEKKSQAQIGRDFGYSRSGISRLLTEAEKQGIVEINVKFPIQRDSYLEQKLINQFGLHAAYVVKPGHLDNDQVLNLVGRQGALYLKQHLRSGMVVGIGWGTSVYEVVNSMPYLQLQDVSVVQVIGAIGSRSNPRVDGPELASLFAEKLNASYQSLHAPHFIDSKEACESMKTQKPIIETFNLAYQSDFILLGIGIIDVDNRFSSLYRSGFLNDLEIKNIKATGGVCNFCGIIYDENGQFIDNEINYRTMTLDITKVTNADRKIIGVAAGKEKTEAIQAALRGGLVDVLITDQSAVKPIIDGIR